jgi:hypothetical protein
MTIEHQHVERNRIQFGQSVCAARRFLDGVLPVNGARCEQIAEKGIGTGDQEPELVGLDGWTAPADMNFLPPKLPRRKLIFSAEHLSNIDHGQ